MHSQADIQRKARKKGHCEVLSRRKGQAIEYSRYFGRREATKSRRLESWCAADCAHSVDIRVDRIR